MSTVRMSELLEQARSFDSSKLKPQTTSWAPLQEGVNEAVSPEQQAAIAISKKNKSKNKDEETEIEESGHTDVASAITNVKVAMSALTKMSGELSKLSPEDSLPSWWTNKVAVAVDKLDGMADYLDAKVESVKLDELVPTSRHVGKSKKNKDMFAVFDTNGEEVKLFKDEDDAREYSLKNHDKLMGHDKKPFKKEEVEPDTMNPRDHVAKSKKNPDMFCVFDTKGNEVKLFKDRKDAEEYAIKNHDSLMSEEVELDESLLHSLFFALWGVGAMVVLPGVIIYDVVNRSNRRGDYLDAKVGKIVGNMVSKFKKDKNYKPTSAEVDASKKLEKEVKSKEPSIFKKAMSILKSIKSKKEEVELDEVFNGTKKDIRKIARATDNALRKRSTQIQKMLKSKTNEKGRGLTDFEFDHISDEGDAIAAELVYRKKRGKDPISDDIPSHLKKFVNEEVELDEAVKISHVLVDTANRNEVVSMASSEEQVKQSKNSAERPPMSVKNKNTLKVVALKKPLSQKAADKLMGQSFKESAELDEAKSSTGYELYHKSFSDAMQHSYTFAKKKFGITVDPKEIDREVASGPKKPSSGKTNSYRLVGTDGKKAIQVQVANLDNKRYELNMYKEGTEFDTMKAYASGISRILGTQGIEVPINELIDPADVDDDASSKDVALASKNIILQLKKSVDMNGKKDVEFASGKQKVPAAIAQKILDVHSKMKPQDKMKFQTTIAKSYKGLLNAIKGK